MVRTVLIAAALALAAGSSQAATLNWEGFGGGPLGTASASVPGATANSGSTDLFVGAGSIPNSICAFNPALFSCANDLEIAFDTPVENLKFDVGGWSVGKAVSVLVLGNRTALGTFDIGRNGTFDLTRFGEVTSLFFDSNSFGGGVAYGNFAFDNVDLPDEVVVPIPAGITLMIGALLTLGILRRRWQVQAPDPRRH